MLSICTCLCAGENADAGGGECRKWSFGGNLAKFLLGI